MGENFNATQGVNAIKEIKGWDFENREVKGGFFVAPIPMSMSGNVNRDSLIEGFKNPVIEQDLIYLFRREEAIFLSNKNHRLVLDEDKQKIMFVSSVGE